MKNKIMKSFFDDYTNSNSFWEKSTLKIEDQNIEY